MKQTVKMGFFCQHEILRDNYKTCWIVPNKNYKKVKFFAKNVYDLYPTFICSDMGTHCHSHHHLQKRQFYLLHIVYMFLYSLLFQNCISCHLGVALSYEALQKEFMMKAYSSNVFIWFIHGNTLLTAALEWDKHSQSSMEASRCGCMGPLSPLFTLLLFTQSWVALRIELSASGFS